MSLIAVSAAKSSTRGWASRSHSSVSLWSPRPSHCVGMLPLTGRISYWPTQATALGPMVRRSTSSGAGTAGMGRSVALQVSRRTAVTTVAVVLSCARPSASFWRISTVQCWVERLVLTGVARISKGPATTAAA